jgi:hypothetical protein
VVRLYQLCLELVSYIYMQSLLSISMDNLGLVVNPMFGYLFGCGFRVLSVAETTWCQVIG